MPGFASGRTTVRALASLLVSGLLGFLVWSLRPGELGDPIDVIGYPTFHDFNYHPIFWTWRVLVWQVPFVAILTYAILMRVGPLRQERPAPRVEREPAPRPAPAAVTVWVATLAVPATLVWYAVSLLPDTAGGGWTRPGLLAGLGYAALVGAVALGLWAARIGARSRTARTSFTTVLATVSAVLGVLVGVGVLLLASRRTLVINADASLTFWPWLPWWLAAAGAAAGLWWVVCQLRGGREPEEVERLVRTWFLGTVLVLAVTMYLPPALGYLEGFDDSQSVLGADLLSDGYFPWRDFMFIHGLFEDGLRSWVGFGLFERSIWGGGASYSMIFAPVYWVFLYWLAVYASRRGSSLVPVGLVVIAASFELPVSTRWFLLGLVLILLAEVLRRRTWPWTAALTAVLFVDAVLAPESAFLVAACLAVLLLSDLTSRPAGVPWWRGLLLVRVFVATGAALSVLLLAFLAVVGALDEFIGYYLYFGPGHVESGAIPILPTNPDFYMQSMVVLGAAVVLTMLFVAARCLHGYPVTPLQWTTFAAALLAGLYGEKALGRFDGGHVYQNLAVSVSLYILLVAGITGALDDAWRRGLRRLTRDQPRAQRFALRTLAQPAACLLVVALVWQLNASAVKLSPGRLHMYSAVPTTDPLVGYQYPDAVDTALLDDIDSVLDTYAGDDGKIFDFTNSPGYLYYLTDREPAIPFVHISMAVVERAQQEVIEQLAEARPSVVVYDNTKFGIAAWDGPRAEVRHFEVAQYLLDHWSPVVAADGLLFLVRDDLLADAPPPPGLNEGEPDTTDLYFSQPTCDWGFSANYLESEPRGPDVELPVRAVAGFSIAATGWAYDAASDQPVDEVLVAVGDQVVGRMTPEGPRPDVATNLGLPEAERSGFAGTVVFEQPADPGPIQAFGVLDDGRAYPLSPPADYVPPKRLVDGDTKIRVGTDRVAGWLEALDGGPRSLGVVDVPADVDLRDYPLATFEADDTIGDTAFTLVDQLGTTDAFGINHNIRVGVLERAGDDIAVRVGSCLQWHGYAGRRLVISQEGGSPIQRVVLSGVVE